MLAGKKRKPEEPDPSQTSIKTFFRARKKLDFGAMASGKDPATEGGAAYPSGGAGGGEEGGELQVDAFCQ